jgi:hypothetical protein
MEAKLKRRLNKRALMALIALFSGIGLPVSGLATHMLHEGSTGSARHFWIVAHEVLGMIFVFGTTWHVILNRKVLAGHLKGSTGRFGLPSREAFWAVVVVAVLFVLVVSHTLADH